MEELPISEYHEHILEKDPNFGYHKNCTKCGRFVEKKRWSYIRTDDKPICEKCEINQYNHQLMKGAMAWFLHN